MVVVIDFVKLISHKTFQAMVVVILNYEISLLDIELLHMRTEQGAQTVVIALLKALWLSYFDPRQSLNFFCACKIISICESEVNVGVENLKNLIWSHSYKD